MVSEKKIENYASAAVLGAGVESLVLPAQPLWMGAAVGAGVYYLEPSWLQSVYAKYALGGAVGVLIAPMAGFDKAVGGVAGVAVAYAWKMYDSKKGGYIHGVY